MKIQRVKAGSVAENLTGATPYIVATREWYGKKAYVCSRMSDGRLFTVYPNGAAREFLDSLEKEAFETLNN